MKRTHITSLLGIGASLLISMTAANAHFLWGNVTTGAEPTYHLTISETPVEATDADHIEQAKDSSAWVIGDKNLKLTDTEGRFVAPLPASAKVVAAGYSWGVYPNSKKPGSYLLDLYAKAAVAEAGAAQSAGLPLEVFARREGNEFIATVKAEDKRLAKAEVVVVSPDATEEKTLITNENGSVRFPYTKPGLYTVRVINVVTPRSGAHNGKHYTSVLGFSTLTFTVAE